MPGKKKGKKKGKAKASAKASDTEDGENNSEPSEKEMLLQKELEALTEELKVLKKDVEDLRQENEWLQEEAQQTRLESHEYMSYMSKKTQKRQTTIISLSDRNQKELDDIKEQKEQILKEYAEKKDALRKLMLEKEHELSIANSDLVDMEEYKTLQNDQEAEIARLEDQVSQMRGKHSEAIQKLKSHFLRDKRTYQQESDSRIQEMAQQATQEAQHCLTEHTSRIAMENRELRKELLQLIRRTRAMHHHRQELETQHKALLRELQYGRDLKRLRGTRQNRLYRSFGIDQREEEKSAVEKGQAKNKSKKGTS